MSWPEKAEMLQSLIGKLRLHPRVVEFLESWDGKIGVACSGGLDSVAVLLLIYAVFPELRSRLTALHFNHGLRGEESNGDEQFVKQIAYELDLPFLSQRWIRRSAEKPVSESAARHARQAFFDEFISQAGKAVIVTGHHQDDILETLMLRIARSSSLAGLSAPRPVTFFSEVKTFVRPLLNISKQDLFAAMRSSEIEWRDDSTNADNCFDRNRLRNEVIPIWKQSTQFNLEKASALVREYLEEADEVVESYLDSSNYPAPSSNPADLPNSLGPRAVARRWLQKWLSEMGIAGNFQLNAFNELLARVYEGGQCKWSAGGGFLVMDGKRLSFQLPAGDWQHSKKVVDLELGGTKTLPNGGELSSRWLKPSAILLNDLENGKYSELSTVLIDSDCLQNKPLRIRYWQPGDRYRPLNAPGVRKLQDMYVDRKISREERKTLPVVITIDSLILWCPGLPVNHEARVTEKTKKILQLTYADLH